MKKIAVVSGVVVVLIIVLVVSYIRVNSTTANIKDVYFTVEKGSSLSKISIQLMEKGIIKFPNYFVLYAKINGFERKVQAGNFILKPKMKLKDLLLKLQSPKSDYVIVTIPEGFTLYQIASNLEEKNLANKQSILSKSLKSIDTGGLINTGEGVFFQLEGYLFPETYYIPTDAGENEVVETLFNQFLKVFSEEYRAQAKESGLSINEVITIASLIEEEAANDEERKSIAGVIYNRLKIKMPLQIDASVIYAITTGEKHIDRLSYKDLEVDSEYNTYLNKGLPPGPIASPGKASIEAALYPEDNDYLYYVLGENGHVFSKTYSEHLANIEKYLKQ